MTLSGILKEKRLLCKKALILLLENVVRTEKGRKHRTFLAALNEKLAEKIVQFCRECWNASKLSNVE